MFLRIGCIKQKKWCCPNTVTIENRGRLLETRKIKSPRFALYNKHLPKCKKIYTCLASQSPSDFLACLLIFFLEGKNQLRNAILKLYNSALNPNTVFIADI